MLRRESKGKGCICFIIFEPFFSIYYVFWNYFPVVCEVLEEDEGREQLQPLRKAVNCAQNKDSAL